MPRYTQTISIILTISLAVPLAGAVQETPDGASIEDVAECPTSVIDSVLQTIGSEANPSSDEQPFSDSQVIFPEYKMCNKEVIGACTVTEEVDTTVTVSGGPRYHLSISQPTTHEMEIDTKVRVTTYVYCEGTIEVDFLHRNGLGIRTVTTLLGNEPETGADAFASTGSPGDVLAAAGADRGRGDCNYVGQVDYCITHHEGQWTADRTFAGRVISDSGSVSVCGALDVYNAEGAMPYLPEIDEPSGLRSDEYEWHSAACGIVLWNKAPTGEALL